MRWSHHSSLLLLLEIPILCVFVYFCNRYFSFAVVSASNAAFRTLFYRMSYDLDERKKIKFLFFVHHRAFYIYGFWKPERCDGPTQSCVAVWNPVVSQGGNDLHPVQVKGTVGGWCWSDISEHLLFTSAESQHVLCAKLK